MKHHSRLFATICLGCALAMTVAGGMGALAAEKRPVQGYTRTNKKTGEPIQVRPYRRRPPQPKAVEVRPYERGGKPVAGHNRRRPGNAASPPSGPPGAKPKA